MQNWNRLPRFFLITFLLMILCAGIFAPGSDNVAAKPLGANALDVFISEVAWGGTSASFTSDEWIELYNNTNSTIDLSGWTLIADGDGDPNISLTGIIPANGYYLLESGDDTTISNITADQIYSGSLGNGGEVLRLKDSLSNQIDIANGNGNGWDKGSASATYWSMERFLPVAVIDTWVDGKTTGLGLNADGNPLNGTPRNSKIDLSLTMAVNNSATSVGSNVEFTITITNSGTYTAKNVTVKDVFPTAGLTYQPLLTVASIGTTYDVNTSIWNIGDLASGASATLKLTGLVTSEGVKTNRAEIWTVYQFDPDSTPGNGITTEDDYALAKATTASASSLNITNDVNNSNPNVGSNIVFTITVNNPSGNPFDATNAQVLALLPAGLTYISQSNTLGTAYNSSSGIWDIGTLAINTSATIYITAKVTTSNPPAFSATLSSDEYLDSTAIETINNPLPGEANLSLTQSVNSNSGTAGNVILTVSVYNDGPDKATGVNIMDLLPSGLTFVSYSSPGTTYSSATGIWTIDNLADQDSASLNITAKVSSSGTSTNNFVEVWQSDQYDPDSTPGNGENGEDDNASLEVAIADLSLSESVDVTSDTAIFTIKVGNAGPDDATGVEVETKLPELLSTYTFVSSGGTQGTYDKATGIWDVGSLADGANATLTITTTTTGVLSVNWAEVSASDQVDPDSVPANSSKAEDDDASAPSADLYLTHSVNPVNPDVNANVIFNITVGNLGAGDTTNVQVKDILPTGLTYVSHTATVGTYSSGTGIWTVGSLAVGASKTLSITAKVTTSGIKTNQAEVWKSDVSDPDSTPGNSSTIEDDDASAAITSYRSIIINEVAWSGTAASVNDEWIELYNPGSASINITGWTLKSKSNSLNIILSGTIASGGYFLLERDDNFTISDITADQIYIGSLSDNGELLTLRDGSANFIDTANNNEGSWPAGSASSSFGSMERVSTNAESDSSWSTNTGVKKNGKNANGGNILGTPKNSNTVASNATPVRTATPIPTPTPVKYTIDPRAIINEILPRPGFDWNQDGKVNVFDEFIEIKNLTPIDINLKGWVIDDELNAGSDPFPLPDLILKPGQRIVYYASQTNILLSDGGDTVRLLNPGGKTYDTYTYAIAKVEDESICRLPDGNINGSWFEDCIPTPNLTNSREGVVPSMPQGDYVSPVCDLPDTIPTDFFLAECHGYGANIWDAYHWDQAGWLKTQIITQHTSKWQSFIK